MQIPDHISSSYIQNCFKSTSLNKSKSSKKLASGYRINTAADDAAKLSISEKMRAQIRGLDQASNNIQDSISFLQVADGALETVSAITQRIRELAVQAANDTYTDQDRAQIQQECDQLQEEMLSIFDRSTFHTKSIFNGSDSLKWEMISERLLQNKLPIFDTEQMMDGKEVPTEIMNFLTQTLRLEALTEDILKQCDETGMLNLTNSQMAYYARKLLDLYTSLENFVGYEELDTGQKGLKDAQETLKEVIQKEEQGERDLDLIYSVRNKLDRVWPETSFAAFHISSTHLIIYALSGRAGQEACNPKEQLEGVLNSKIPIIYNKLNDKTLSASVKANVADTSLLQLFQNKNYDSAYKMLSELSGLREITLSLQNGANAYQGVQLQVTIPTIPKSPFDLSSYSSANRSIHRADQFFTRLSAARAEIGACQNRLESALSYTAQGAESLQDSESRMRDANMAKETADYLKTKLQNEFQLSFLAQKNSSNQDGSVLSFPK